MATSFPYRLDAEEGQACRETTVQKPVTWVGGRSRVGRVRRGHEIVHVIPLLASSVLSKLAASACEGGPNVLFQTESSSYKTAFRPLLVVGLQWGYAAIIVGLDRLPPSPTISEAARCLAAWYP